MATHVSLRYTAGKKEHSPCSEAPFSPASCSTGGYLTQNSELNPVQLKAWEKVDMIKQYFVI
jgi:hypothetical protein